MRHIKIILSFLLILLPPILYAQTVAEKSTQDYLQTIVEKRANLKKFLHAFPKGADLHYHPTGSSLTENLLRYAEKDELCLDKQTYRAYVNTKCRREDLLNNVKRNDKFYDALLDAWSMNHFSSKTESGHDHFFKAFQKFSVITAKHLTEIVAEIVERAALQNVLYLELTLAPDRNESGSLGKKLGWDPNFDKMRAKLLANDIDKIVTKISHRLNEIEVKKNNLLSCDILKKSGCDVTIRYLYQVYREQAPEKVFAQLLAGFIAVSKDSRIVGINLVQPEDGKISMRDYDLQMRMIGYFHKLYPKVRISLHAGELNNRLVPEDGLKFHIRSAVEIAGADRIGHGVSIMNENDAQQLLQAMAKKKILVEINLSSNNYILEVQGKDHPLPLYLNHNVPIALSTDDEGISREDLTQQYLQAIENYQLSYETLKTLSRNSITYSFLPGESLWEEGSNYTHKNYACVKDNPESQTLTPRCKNFLLASEKAHMQWELEKRFHAFELRYTRQNI